MSSFRFPGAFPDNDKTDTTSISNLSIAESDDGSFVTALEYPPIARTASVLKARKVSVVPASARVTMLQGSGSGAVKPRVAPRAVAVAPSPATVLAPASPVMPAPGPSKPSALSLQEKRPLGQAVFARRNETFTPFAEPCAGQCNQIRRPAPLPAHIRNGSTSTTSTTQSVPSLSSSRSSSVSSTSSTSSSASSSSMGGPFPYDEWLARSRHGHAGGNSPSDRGVSSVFAADFGGDPFRPKTFQPGRSSQHGSLHLPPPTPPPKTPRAPSSASSVYAAEVDPFRPRTYQAPRASPHASLHLPKTPTGTSPRPHAGSIAAEPASGNFLLHDPYGTNSASAAVSSSRLTCASSLFGRDLSDDPFRPPTFVEPDASKHGEIYLPTGIVGNTSGRGTPAGDSIRSTSSMGSSAMSSDLGSTRSRTVSASVKGFGKKVTGMLSRNKATTNPRVCSPVTTI